MGPVADGLRCADRQILLDLPTYHSPPCPTAAIRFSRCVTHVRPLSPPLPLPPTHSTTPSLTNPTNRERNQVLSLLTRRAEMATGRFTERSAYVL
ncbi:unnamed protein product [Rhizoctonia solani]|uniref:Uncharacterized protein n=1 Tax=Rhizoctonia solani TaxID=456999 RepID=A0A8H3GWA5_9AGAM|nr:unnamed protein product [Rhizoctonia solani]CAE6509653.1 unnamed protein product [Rhizoctonia solani]